MANYDPVAEHLMPRFSGPTTFMKLPSLEQVNDPDIVVVGAPFDGGTTFRPGARMGPSAIREASSALYPYHRGHRQFLTHEAVVADGGDLIVVPGNIVVTLVRMTEQLDKLGEAAVLLLGGDHSVSLAALRSLSKRVGSLALIHFDAHHDLWHDSWGEKYSHATVFRRAIEEGLIDPAFSLQVGLRGGLDQAEQDHFGEDLHIQQITTDDWYAHSASWLAEQIHRRVGTHVAYLSVDIDVVDPAYACGTGTPEAGGPSSYMVLQALRLISAPLAGADVVELSPDLDVTRTSSLFAATTAYEVLFLLARARGRNKTKETV
ncbi:agmatinase [Sulfobacillus thermotolerans]|uniref:Agmatinase n=1 Tax=Sulfobacillus thermotolerans TaxID=338644 RepID=A0ABN5H3G7_9FIRM|nr:agmatinase [Sulfobacillus thermotolerans]